MRLGITLPSRTNPIVSLGDKARRAEDAGFDSVWSYEVYRNPFIILSQAAAATSTVTIGSGLAAAFSRSPFVSANAAADIDEISGGRFLYGLGTGVPEFMKAFHSTDAERPLRRLSEYVDVLRLSWQYLNTGTAPRFEGQYYQFKPPRGNPWGERDMPREQIPIALAAMGPKLLQLVGEKADAWLGYFVTPEYFADFCHGHLETGAHKAGRSVSDIRVVAETVCSVHEDSGVAMQRARRQVGFYATHSAGAQVATVHGLESAVKNLRRGFIDKGIAAFEETPDELVDLLSITGTPSEVRNKLAKFEGFVDDLILHTPYVPPIKADESSDSFDNILSAFGGSEYL
ncbi:LLM class flavin-dependent oxidoreductase [Gordonia rubripertincta]|uniref:LLM class flavin-dependent oxidoreductase n=1 Tax=Gordonia rubripertincta TaxID=36822 RepID=A0ABT4MVL6_GORRU|nr:LLM class flavin-dependent oxidoreductase [Gordonia rubripertincta]MCZ4551053.1 LLM class flavin-dependent oxidoreductase [Gordonia rubripertincta]